MVKNHGHAENFLVESGDEIIILPSAFPKAAFSPVSGGAASSTALEVATLPTVKRVAAQRASLLKSVLGRLAAQVNAGEVQNIVEIRGEVRYPGIYPYAPSLALERLLVLAGGMLESAEESRVELARLMTNADGRQVVVSRAIFADADGAFKQEQLAPRDRINVFQNPDWRNDINVTIEGEVLYPGQYSIQRGDSLVDVVKRAGGVTAFAYPNGAILSRLSLKERESKELERLRDRLKEQVATLSLRKSSQVSGFSVSPGEALEAVDQLNSVEALGRLVIDFPAALNGVERHNIVLEDGDRLYIPAHSNTVSVVGEVQYPSSHVFEEGLDYEAYVERAGGLRERADSDRVYVIRANGQVILPKNSWFGMAVEEGDTIVVPIDTEYTDRISLFTAVTQILYQLAIAYDVTKD